MITSSNRIMSNYDSSNVLPIYIVRLLLRDIPLEKVNQERVRKMEEEVEGKKKMERN